MLHPFVSIPAPRAVRVDAGRVATSTIVHAALAAFAVSATTVPPARLARAASSAVEHVVFSRLVPEEREHAEHAERGTAGAARHARRARIVAAPTHVPDVLDTPMPDMSALSVADLPSIDTPVDVLVATASGNLGFDDDALAQWRGAAKTVPLPNAARGSYTEDVVDRTVAPYESNPRPRYPSQLQSMSVEESFVVRFVVDSSGKVDAHSFEFPSSVHKLFVRAVRDALLRSRYSPAVLGGRAVAQLVQQRYSFVMVR
jgi:TonB family protein